MTARHVLGVVAFMAFDTNGTILIAGVHESAMKDVNKFRSRVKSMGMYASLTKVLLEIAEEHGSTVSGSSEGPRYNYPNERKPMSQEQFDIFVSDALALCNKLRRDVLFLSKNDFKEFKKMKSVLPKGCSNAQYKKEYINSKCMNFLKDISNHAGRGVGHMLSLTFFQLSCLVGLLPPFLYSWAIVSKGSGGYQFMNKMLSSTGQKNLSTRIVNKWIDECNVELGKAISPNVNSGLIENMLCEFKREEASQTSTSRKKDYIFFIDHRGAWQNLYRLEFKSSTRATLHIRPGKDNINSVFKNKVSVDIGGWSIMSEAVAMKRNSQKCLTYWVNTSETCSLDCLFLDESKISMTRDLSDCFKIDT